MDTKLVPQQPLKVGAYRMLHLLRFIVDAIPLHMEDLGQHPLDQVVPDKQPVGNAAAGVGQRNPFPCHDSEAVAAEAANGGRYRGRGDIQPARKRSRNDWLAL